MVKCMGGIEDDGYNGHKVWEGWRMAMHVGLPVHGKIGAKQVGEWMVEGWAKMDLKWVPKREQKMTTSATYKIP